jgi:hypothetical protein
MSDMSPRAMTERLRRAAAASDLRTESRLRYKLDMSPSGIARRLQKVEALRRLCLELGRIGARAR